MQWVFKGGSPLHSKTHHMIHIFPTKNQSCMLFSMISAQFTIGLVMKLWWQTRPFIIYSSSIMSPKVNWAVFKEGPSDSFKFEIAIWGWLELLKTYDGKFCLKFFSSTAVRSDSCQIRQLSGNACHIAEFQFLSPPWFFTAKFLDFIFLLFGKEILTKKWVVKNHGGLS